jgi:four helix bundle protein
MTTESLTLRGMFKSEKLDAWQKAIDLADLVYSKTKSSPADERFGLTNQTRRAAVSISSNIAEGSARVSDADFARFVEIAAGSLFEVVSESTVGKRQGYLSEDSFAAIYKAAEQQARMLSGFAPHAGVALSSMYPEAKSVVQWLRHGRYNIVAYLVGFCLMLGLLGWRPDTPHGRGPSPGVTSAAMKESFFLRTLPGGPRLAEAAHANPQ